uniref:Large ribosomal subunit protein uL4m n=1 Tax=Ceriodaphnia reticulata TaxID=302197 RepID=A0A4Y7M0A9_9CRUS|nr:EOG090X0EDZ [Ceriodaphnia reticulata]SVE73215.1 EOG090X0EDZ [Ceriodaphnia reticulata]
MLLSNYNQSKITNGFHIGDEQLPLPTVRPPLPIISSRKLAFPPKFKVPRQVWVSNMDTIEEEKLGLVDVHPEVFAERPRVDIIHENVRWQQLYRHVSYATTKLAHEVRGGGRKPRQQKGSGRSRHGSIRSPIWKGGGVVHGPRGPTSYFYMLGFNARLNGLRSTLSAKLAQDDLHVVESLDLPTDDPAYMEKLVEERGWGPAVLFVDDSDIMPLNITAATDPYGHYNLMPVYGLNVYSMLKHQTLVLTLAALERIEERLLFHMNRNDAAEAEKPFKLYSK